MLQFDYDWVRSLSADEIINNLGSRKEDFKLKKETRTLKNK